MCFIMISWFVKIYYPDCVIVNSNPFCQIRLFKNSLSASMCVSSCMCLCACMFSVQFLCIYAYE